MQIVLSLIPLTKDEVKCWFYRRPWCVSRGRCSISVASGIWKSGMLLWNSRAVIIRSVSWKTLKSFVM